MPRASRQSTTVAGLCSPRDEPRMVPPCSLMFETRSMVRSMGGRLKLREPLIAVEESVDTLDAVAEAEFQGEAADDVVESRAEAAAGDDAGGGAGWVEEDLAARAGGLEGG